MSNVEPPDPEPPDSPPAAPRSLESLWTVAVEALTVGLALGVLGSVAFFVLAIDHQDSGDCFGLTHYEPRAALALVILVGLGVLCARPWRGASGARAVIMAASTAALCSLGLAAAVTFAAALSCTAG